MFLLIGYFLLILLELFFVTLYMVYTLSLIYSSIKGSPYVPTRGREIDIIFEGANLKRGSYFIDLGCGDGRIVRHAVGKHHQKGLGVDINPILITYARLLSHFKKVKNINFKRHNIFDEKLTIELKKADFIYLFLMPKLLEKLAIHLVKNTKKNAIIISHGFKIAAFDSMLVNKLNRTPFPTYYYKM